MKNFIFCIVVFCTTLSFSQSKSFEISGTLISKSDQKTLESATVYLEKVKDSSLVTYTITDKNGKFKLEGKTKQKQFRLNISFIGYRTYTKIISISEVSNLGNIALEDANVLDEIVLKSKAPIIIKKDTLEFNVSSFKTKKDANVEDLLKKLPGVEVDENGKITVNGKEVNKILVNGKPFFGDDPTITTRSLSKTIIEKVQITDTKTKSQAFTGESSSGDEKTINLTINKENNKGVFGRVAGGAGTDKRYEFAGMFNYFDNDRRISVLAGGNNTNSPGFSFGEIQKMFGSGGGASMRVSNGQMSFSLDGRSFGGGQGITTSKNTGFNYADKIGKKVDVSADYFYSSSDSEDKKATQRENILPNERYFTNSNTQSTNQSDNHSANFELDIKIDSTLLINIQPSFQYSTNKRKFDKDENSLDENQVLTNESNTSSFVESKGKSFENNLSITKNLGSKGSFLRLQLINELNSSTSDDFLSSETEIYGNTPETISRNQFTDEGNDVNNFETELTYRLPLSDKEFHLDFNYGLSNQKRENIKSTFNYNETSQSFADFNTDLSTDFKYINKRNIQGLKLGYKKDKLNFNIGSSYIIRTLESQDFLRPEFDLKRKFNAFGVTSRFRYRFSSKKSFSIRYRLRNKAPQLRQLQPFEDVSNPLNTIIGNPNLEPSNSHTVGFHFNLFDFQKGTGFFSYMWSVFSNNQVVAKTTIDENFLRNTTYTNVNGVYTTNLGARYSKSIKIDSVKTLKLELGVNLSKNRNINFNNNTRYASNNTVITPNTSFTFTWKDILEIMPRYSLSFNNNKYDIEKFNDTDFISHSLSIETTTMVPKKLEWKNNIIYRYDPDIAADFQKSAWFWNSTLSYSVLQNKGMITLKVYDLLNQNTNARREATQNYIEDSQSTVLQQYFMIGFSYKFNTLGKAGEVRKRRYWRH